MHYFQPPVIVAMTNEDCRWYYRRAVISFDDGEVRVCDRIVAITSTSSPELIIFYDPSLLPMFADQYASAVNEALEKGGLTRRLQVKKGMLFWKDGTKFNHTQTLSLGQD
jgi:hypothetical protein